VDVHVRWLREKIESDPSQPAYIRTVRGTGYRFESPAEQKAAQSTAASQAEAGTSRAT